MRRRWMVASYTPNGVQTGDTGRRFFTRWGAERERRAYVVETQMMVPQIVDGRVDYTLPYVRLVTYRIIEAIS